MFVNVVSVLGRHFTNAQPFVCGATHTAKVYFASEKSAGEEWWGFNDLCKKELFHEVFECLFSFPITVLNSSNTERLVYDEWYYVQSWTDWNSPGTHEYNGLVERAIRVLAEMTRAALIHSQPLVHLWPECMHAIPHTRDLLPCRSNPSFSVFISGRLFA